MTMSTATTLALVVAFSGCGIATPRPSLPDAKFDRGGTTFDLEQMSAERFPIPEGGFSGRAARLTDSDPATPLAVRVDWAELRRTSPGGAKGLRLRYRYRNHRPGTIPGKAWLTIRGLTTQPDGTRVIAQLDWRRPLVETGNQWADFYIPDTGLVTKSDTLDLLLDPGGGLGELEVKDGRPVPFVKREEEDPAKYLVAVKLDGVGLLDGVFTLASGGVDNLVKFPWKRTDKTAQMDRRKLSLRFELPPGVRASNKLDSVPSELMPPPDWHSWNAPFFHVTTELKPGSEVGEGTVTAWYDGKPCSKPLKVKFSVGEPAVAKAVPKRYFNGANLLGPEAVYSSDADLESYTRMMYAAGLRGVNGNAKFTGFLKKIGPINWDSSGASWIVNGFKIGTAPSTWDKCPDDQRFVTVDKEGKIVPYMSAVCPSTVYLRKSYFRDYVVPGMKQTIGNRRSIMPNWEPNEFFGKGCFCKNCLSEFAASIGVAPADVASDWPACVRIGGRYFEKALKFRARQHGKLMKTIDRAVREVQGERSGGFAPEVVWTEVSGETIEDPLALEVAGAEYVGSLEWMSAWGPYVAWNAQRPYFPEKRKPVSEWTSAKVVMENVRREYNGRPKLISFPNGMQTEWVIATPEWMELCLDSYFLNGWGGSLVYFMRGLDVRWWRAFANATTRAAYYEEYVLDGSRRDDATMLRTVAEYAAPCHQVSAYMPKQRNISPLQHATYDFNGGRIVATVNFWEKGTAFFRLATKGLATGAYTVVSDRETLWTKDGGGFEWTAEELENGIIFAGVGAARTKVFEIRPASEHAERSAKNRQTQTSVEAAYREMKPQLEKEARRDHEEESGRTNLCPDGYLVI